MGFSNLKKKKMGFTILRWDLLRLDLLIKKKKRMGFMNLLAFMKHLGWLIQIISEGRQ